MQLQHAPMQFVPPPPVVTTTPLKCPFCNFAAALTYEDCFKHVARMHEDELAELPASGGVCDLFRSSHMPAVALEPAPLPDIYHWCGYCEFTSLRKIDVTHHRKKHHPGKKPYTCPFCSFTSDGMDSRWSHVNLERHISDTANYTSSQLMELLKSCYNVPIPPPTRQSDEAIPIRATMPRLTANRVIKPKQRKQPFVSQAPSVVSRIGEIVAHPAVSVLIDDSTIQ